MTSPSSFKRIFPGDYVRYRHSFHRDLHGIIIAIECPSPELIEFGWCDWCTIFWSNQGGMMNISSGILSRNLEVVSPNERAEWYYLSDHEEQHHNA